MSTELVRVPQTTPVLAGGAGIPSKEEFEGLVSLAGWIARARMFPQYDTAEKVFTALLYVRDLGVAMLPGMAKGHFINGKFGVEVDVKLAVVQGRVPDFEWQILEQTKDRCRLRGRVGKQAEWVEVAFALSDAPAELQKKDTYKNYSRDMLLWRALGRLLKYVAGPALYGMPLVIQQDIASDPELLEEENGAPSLPDGDVGEAPGEEAAPPTESTEAAPDITDYRALFTARAAICGWKGNAKLRDAVNHGMKALGLQPVTSSAAVGPYDWKRLWEWLDSRYDEKGQLRAQGATVPAGTYTEASLGATLKATRYEHGPEATAPIDAPTPVDDEPAPPITTAPDIHMIAEAEGGSARGVYELAMWAESFLPNTGEWMREHPAGSGRVFFMHGATLRLAGDYEPSLVSVAGGRRTGLPQLIQANHEDANLIASDEKLAALGRALVTMVDQLVKVRDQGQLPLPPLPAKAAETLAGARAGGGR